MKENKLKISVAGIRGIYPDVLSPEFAFQSGLAFGTYLKEKKVFVGRDTRVSGEVLKSSLISGLLASGKDVIDLGIVPTPTVGFLIEKIEKAGGVIITASHNPLPYNGIKFFSSKGCFLNEKEGKCFLNILKRENFKIFKEPGNLFYMHDGVEKHFSSIYKKIDIEKIKKRKFKIVVDCCQGVGAIFSEKFLKNLGCKVILINSKPLGKFSHNPEPLPENLIQLCKSVIEEKADIGFAQDPDGDRLAVVSEEGKPIGEELTIVLAIEQVLSKKISPVVVNLSTTSLVEEISKKFNACVYRTKIGEINVVEKMKKVKSVIGGEGNGGVIWKESHYGRDSYVGMALILELLASKNIPISEIIKEYPDFYMEKKKLYFSEKEKVEIFNKIKKYYKNEKIDYTDGMKIIKDKGWIHIRFSGTEPLLRLFVEGKSKEISKLYMKEILSVINS